MRIPTFSRQSGNDSDGERPAVATGANTGTTPVRQRTEVPARHDTDETTLTDGRVVRDDRDAANRDANVAIAERDAADRANADRATAAPERKIVETPARDDRKPRASLLATFGLIFSVVGAMLVLSGPLLGYGIGLAVLALVLSLSGISATGSRHIAGKTDALIGMIVSLAAIVLGVLALTGSLSWLGTDTQPVNSLREWLDTQFSNRF